MTTLKSGGTHINAPASFPGVKKSKVLRRGTLTPVTGKGNVTPAPSSGSGFTPMGRKPKVK